MDKLLYQLDGNLNMMIMMKVKAIFLLVHNFKIVNLEL